MVLLFMILFVIFSNVALGQYNDKDENKNQASPSKYGGEFLKATDKNDGYIQQTNLPNFLFVSNNDENPNPGPQMFIPPQIARISEFRAPDQFKFVPPEDQQYRPRHIDHQQPPVLFDQPEFAVIEPIVPIRPQYPHYLREILKQQGYIIVEQEQVPRLQVGKEDSEELIDDNQLPPITKNNFNNFGRNSRFDNGDVELIYGSSKLVPKTLLKGIRKVRGVRRLR
ncbi:uncharacterized protein [Onthophagus taurus]|uniref:uncharacterized protein n=1 Tax=Onthophagus taurus TaxID=166361 RepID=UPI000C20479D|nr:uncharacterized protein LOC111414414 [Onthophagus taurus]